MLDQIAYELTIGFRRVQQVPCSRKLEDYDGFKKFAVNLSPGDSITLTGEFSAQALSFCIVRASGPPEVFRLAPIQISLSMWQLPPARTLLSQARLAAAV
jgi:hypothetical protein